MSIHLQVFANMDPVEPSFSRVNFHYVTKTMTQNTPRVRSYIQENTSLQIEAETLRNRQLTILVISRLTMTRDILTLLAF